MCRTRRRRSRSSIRGNLATPGAKIGPGALAFLTDPDNQYEPKPPFAGSSSTGRRLALARWLTRPGSRPAALLARVLANRIWQHHFGTGLVATSDNLGYTGSPPTHPELLEFLADRTHAIRLERQGAAPADPDLFGLSPVEYAPGRRPLNRSRQSPAGALSDAPARRRGDPRRHARRHGRAR